MRKRRLPPPGWLLLALLLGWSCRSRPAEAALTGAKDRSPEVLSQLASAFAAHQRGNLRLAEEFLRKALKNSPDDPDIALDLGDTLIQMGHPESARVHYEEFLARHPSVPSVRLAYGLTLMGLGRLEESAREIQIAAAKEPDDLPARLNLGIALAKLGRYEQAVPHLQRAAELAPSEPVPPTELGIVLLRLNRYAESAASLERAVRLKPDNVPALFNLGQCYARLGREREARETLERFARASESREHYLDLKRLFHEARGRSDTLTRAGRPEKGLEALRAYEEDLKDFPPYLQELGVAYVRLGRRADAVKAFEQAVARDPSLSEAHAQLVLLYQESGETEKAMRARQGAVRGSSPEKPPETP